MILIADSGSTKTMWCLLNKDGSKTYFHTEGYNPFYVDTDYIIHSFNKSFPQLIQEENVTKLFFYGAGCTPEKAGIVRNAMSLLFPLAEIEVETDLLASARSLLGKEPGFVSILGTGTNSCLYDGEKVTHHVSPLGYMLGDEGSGNYIGKKLLVDFMRGNMPDELQDRFVNDYKLTSSEIMERIYRQPYPNRFCASFSKFLKDHISHPYASGLITQSFYDFFEKQVNCYPEIRHYSFNSIGSVAYFFYDILIEVVKSFGMEPGYIIQSPINDLVKYHSGVIS